MEMSSISILTRKKITVAITLPSSAAVSAAAAAATAAVLEARDAATRNAAAAGFFPGESVLVIVHPNLEHSLRNSDSMAEFLHRCLVAPLHLPPQFHRERKHLLLLLPAEFRSETLPPDSVLHRRRHRRRLVLLRRRDPEERARRRRRRRRGRREREPLRQRRVAEVKELRRDGGGGRRLRFPAVEVAVAAAGGAR